MPDIKFVFPEETRTDPKLFNDFLDKQITLSSEQFGATHKMTTNLLDIAAQTRGAKSMNDVMSGLMNTAKIGMKARQPNGMALDIHNQIFGHGRANKPEAIHGGVKDAYGDFFQMKPQGMAVVIDGLSLSSSRNASSRDRAADREWGQESPSSQLVAKAEREIAPLPGLKI